MLNIIMPIHELSKEDHVYLKRAQESLAEQTNKNFKLIYVHPSLKFDDKIEGVNVDHYKIKGALSYTKVINLMAEKTEGDWFSILEFDDVLMPSYVDNFYNHVNYYGDRYDVYLNVVFEVDNNDNMMGIRNETAWVINNTDELGVLNFDPAKKNINNLSLVGAFYKKDQFLKFKTKIEAFFNQEYILRSLNKGQEIYVIPHIGVKHTNNRKGSYFEILQDTLTLDHRQQFFNAAMSECYFDDDRDINLR
jgi:hypothetical protein